MKIRLGEADRERLGAPEWLDVDLTHLSTEEAEALEAASGADYTVVAGSGVAGMRAKVWLGLHRAGLEAEWDKVRFDLAALDVARPGGGGKARSGPGDATTPSTSATSSRRSPRRRSASST